jgi:hypothetical protein
LTAGGASGGLASVPEHDAFGRPVDEDPLAALRGATEPAPEPSSAAAQPSSAATEPAPPPPSPATAPAAFVRPRRRPGPGIIVVLVVVLLVAGSVPALVAIGGDVGDRIEELLPPEVRIEGAAQPPRGLQRASMIRRANFAAAMETLERARLGRPATLRVAAERIDATLVVGRRRMNQVQIGFDGELRRVGTSAGAPQATIGYGRIDPAAPERLVRRAAARTKHAPGGIDYLVLSTGPGLPWGAYFKDGTIVQGDARGRPRRVL